MNIIKDYALAADEGDSRKARYIMGVLHDVGNPNSTARNNLSILKITGNQLM